MDACSQKLDEIAGRVRDGSDYHKLPRFYNELDPRDAIGDRAERNHDLEIEAKQHQWLNAKGIK